jgi:hypothetical protein
VYSDHGPKSESISSAMASKTASSEFIDRG